jgi:phosphatidylserine/phosphatidylglycerophosphate/cardiolipin synthase-like enzyme
MPKNHDLQPSSRECPASFVGHAVCEKYVTRAAAGNRRVPKGARGNPVFSFSSEDCESLPGNYLILEAAMFVQHFYKRKKMPTSNSLLLYLVLGGLGNAVAAELPKLEHRVQPARAQQSQCSVKAGFSPSAGAADLALSTINGARSSIRMATYSFTDPVYAKALLQAKRRGVDVAVVSDSEHNGRRARGAPSVVSFLRGNGIPVMVTNAYAIQHNKFIVADGKTVQTGSMNYSRAGNMSNAENVIVLSECAGIAKAFLDNWDSLWKSGVGKNLD